RAVGIRDDASVPRDRLGIDLRHDERNRGVHAESGGVVDDDRARSRGNRREALGDRASGREQRDAHSAETLLGQLRNRDCSSVEGQRAAGRTRRGGEAQLGKRKAPSLEAVDELDADGAGCADDRDYGRGGERAVGRQVLGSKFVVAWWGAREACHAPTKKAPLGIRRGPWEAAVGPFQTARVSGFPPSGVLRSFASRAAAIRGCAMPLCGTLPAAATYSLGPRSPLDA